MKCKCNGNLKRIAVDCYQCEVCGIKQKIAIAYIPLRVDIKPAINVDIIASYGSDDHISTIAKDIIRVLANVQHKATIIT